MNSGQVQADQKKKKMWHEQINGTRTTRNLKNEKQNKTKNPNSTQVQQAFRF